MTGAYGIRQPALDYIADAARRHGVGSVVLFGSRARGDNRERSDIDLACSGGDFARFSTDVDEFAPTLLAFDFVNLDDPVQPGLRQAIADEGVVLYA